MVLAARAAIDAAGSRVRWTGVEEIGEVAVALIQAAALVDGDGRQRGALKKLLAEAAPLRRSVLVSAWSLAAESLRVYTLLLRRHETLGRAAGALLNPTLLVEVLSPSTEAYDRGEKLQHHREIPSLREVLHVSTRERLVMHHRRLDTGQWVLTERREGEAELPPLGGAVRVDDVYDKVDFERPDA